MGKILEMLVIVGIGVLFLALIAAVIFLVMQMAKSKKLRAEATNNTDE